MFARCVVVIMTLGACAGILLAARQARIQAAHDLAEARLRTVQRDQELWKLRATIGAHVTPERVQRLASVLTPLRPVVPGMRVPPGIDARLARAQRDPRR